MERNLESISLISALWAVTRSQKEHALSVGLQVPRCAMLIAKWPQLPTIPHSLLCSHSLQCDFAAFPIMKWNLFLHSLIWPNFVICFRQLNMAEVTMYQCLRLSLKISPHLYLLFLSLFHFLSSVPAKKLSSD